MKHWFAAFAAFAIPALAGPETVERLDPALDRYLAADAAIETLCTGFTWSEGPVWDEKNERLIFSDVPANTAWQWREGDTEASVFLRPSGFTGNDREGGGVGSNGLAFDADGRLLSCEHGDRRVSVLTEKGGKLTVADRFEGKRFHSPNDLAVHSSGAIYFSDPPYGLPRENRASYREIEHNGVYRIAPDGDVTLVVADLERPNGIAFSPDEQFLYVAQSHAPAKHILRYSVEADGSLGEGTLFFDCTDLDGPGSPDGVKIHPDGTVFTTGPGGVLILSTEGELLGRILCTRATANLAFGPGHESLFLTSKDRVLRVPLKKP